MTRTHSRESAPTSRFTGLSSSGITSRLTVFSTRLLIVKEVMLRARARASERARAHAGGDAAEARGGREKSLENVGFLPQGADPHERRARSSYPLARTKYRGRYRVIFTGSGAEAAVPTKVGTATRNRARLAPMVVALGSCER